jgi:hypothetical protein
MVDFNPNENIKNFSKEEKEKIKLAVESTYNKMRPNTLDLKYLFDIFKINIDQTFQGNCSRCKKRVTAYWKQRLKSWEMI